MTLLGVQVWLWEVLWSCCSVQSLSWSFLVFGYVFDCRSTHNPGRYEPYKKLTGLDEPVIRFLEDDGEILTFLESVYKLADTHVARYIQRGFTSLMFSFGCTGGQHRSVYSAQHLAEHISQKFGVEVRLEHREQHITQVFKKK